MYKGSKHEESETVTVKAKNGTHNFSAKTEDHGSFDNKLSKQTTR